VVVFSVVCTHLERRWGKTSLIFSLCVEPFSTLHPMDQEGRGSLLPKRTVYCFFFGVGGEGSCTLQFGLEEPLELLLAQCSLHC